MPHIMNALDKPVTVKVFGNYITFSPRQIKYIANENMALKMNMDHGGEGLVSFPDEAMEFDKNGPEFKKVVSEKIREGKQKRVKLLKQIVHNLEVSLQRDLDIAGIKTSAATFASEGELAALKELAQFKSVEQDEEAFRAEEWEKLRKQVDGNLIKPNTGKNS